MFLAAIVFILSGHFIADHTGHPFNCEKNPKVVCEYKVNE